MSMSSRKSILDLDEQLYDIFSSHPEVRFNDSAIPIVPVNALPRVISDISGRYGVELFDKNEEQQVAAFTRDNPDIEITPELLLGFIAMHTRKKGDGSASPDSSPRTGQEWHDHDTDVHSLSSSPDSNIFRDSIDDLKPSTSNKLTSPFHVKSKRRSPLITGIPPSARRPSAAHRRKSDAGSGELSSDTEPAISGPRTRTPSIPSSQMAHDGTVETFPLPMPGQRDLNSDSEGNSEQPTLLSSEPIREHGESARLSIASLAPYDRMEALEKSNRELGQKLFDSERTLQTVLAKNEAEVKQLEIKLDRVESELAATKQEEELRNKERENIEQTRMLQAQLAELQSASDSASVAQVEIEERKQENLVLKEAIDRLQFDLDVFRETERSAAENTRLGSVHSIGAELLKRWSDLAPDDKVDEQEGSELGDEDTIQTIITKKRRKASDNFNKGGIFETREAKEYSDAHTQYEASEFLSPSIARTDLASKPSMTAVSTQTEPTPPPFVWSSETQTDPELKPRFAGVEVQTDSESEHPHYEHTSLVASHDELERQKRENFSLKHAISRLRDDLDELMELCPMVL